MSLSISCVGGGNIIQAFIRGTQRISDCSFTLSVVGRDLEHSNILAQRLSPIADVRALTLTQACSQSDIIILGVKPAQIQPIATLIAQEPASPLVVSFASGVELADLERFADECTSHRALIPFVRMMPNTPMECARGCFITSFGSQVSSAHKQMVTDFFSLLGSVVSVNEAQQTAATALAGSGPAYVFLFIEALIDAGVHAGLPRAVAQKLAVEMALGSLHVLAENPDQASQLRHNVTSPGGTTAAALTVFEQHNLRSAAIAAVAAAKKQGDSFRASTQK